jgi:hypothetical protein
LVLLKELQPALQQGDRAKQSEVVRRLVALRAPMGDQWQALANLALQNGELTVAREAIDLFVAARGGTPDAQYRKAALLEQSGALREAYALMCTLPADTPNPAANAYRRGTAALFLGEAEEARRQLDRATRLQPQSGPAWLSLAMAADLAQEPELAERIIAAERDIAAAPPVQRAAYYYAQGKAYAESGEPAQGFAAFARGAREMRSNVAYDRNADRVNAEDSLRGYSAARLAALARRQTEPTRRAIFVTGLPRSGTTLVQQILTSHSAVGDGAETSRLGLLADEVRGHSWPALERYEAAHGPSRAAKLWQHWLSERFPAPGRVVDKSLDTTRFIGLAAGLLPEAPLIWVTRDPLDRAWSCFRTFFPAGLPWSFDLEEIAFHFRLEDQLLARWQEILGDRLLVIPFESLVGEPETGIRRVLAHCSLPEEPQVFAPHKSDRTVTTASVMQVRRPISRQAVGSAAPYREFLEPFVTAYRH